MAEGRGGSPMNEMLQNFMMLSQVRNMQDQLVVQQQQVANQHRQQTIVGFGEYLNLLRQSPDPTVHDELEQAYSELGFDRNALKTLREHAVPGQGILRAGAARAGRDAAAGIGEPVTPELAAINRAAFTAEASGLDPGALASSNYIADNLGRSNLTEAEKQRLANATAIRVGSGQDVGAYTQGQTYAGMSPETRTQMEMIRGGVATSAEHNQQMELQWARLRQDERFETGRQALQEVGLGLDAQRISQAVKDGSNPFPLLEQLTTVLGHVSDTKVPKSAAEIEGFTNVANALVAQLTDQGVFPPAGVIIEGTKPDGTKYRLQGSPNSKLNPGETIVGRIPRTMRPEDIARKGWLDYIQRGEAPGQQQQRGQGIANPPWMRLF